MIIGKGSSQVIFMQKTNEVLRNRAKCKICGDIVESKYRHDFKWCKCGAMAVDGGHMYIKRVWDPKYGDKNEVIEEMIETYE